MSAVVIEADFVQWLRDNQALAQRGAWPRYHAAFFDPPYSWSFMNSEWDNLGTAQQYQAWCKEWASMLLDFMFPGALLVAFGGARSYHRLACGIEDAGWEIADSLRVALPAAWVQGQGFPKGHRHSRDFQIMRRGWTGAAISNQAMLDLSLDYRRRMWREEKRWEGWNVALSPAYEALVIARAPRGGHTYASLALTYGTGALAIDAARIGTESTQRHALKPGVLHYGGTNHRPHHDDDPTKRITGSDIGRWPANFALVHDERCTTATCVDGCPVKALGEQSGERPTGGYPAGGVQRTHNGIYGKPNEKGEPKFGASEGSAARFFYNAKSATWEREAGLDGFEAKFLKTMNDGIGERPHNPDQPNAWRKNSHPTVKPITLAQHIATLLKPPTERSRILIPFSGVASEMIGCLLAGWTDITGIEQSAEYAAIARARLKWWSQFDSYDAAKARYDSEQRGRADDATKEAAGQLRLFGEAEEKSA